MKFAIFGDIHANLEALVAVLKDAERCGCEKFVCLGDLVGYGADPGPCLEVVRALDCPIVKGNHDETASRDAPLEGLNPLARESLEWTRKVLAPGDREYLQNLKLVRQVTDFTIVHATLDTPGNWTYATNPMTARSSFCYQFTQLCFHGHTHTPVIFVEDETTEPYGGLSVRLLDGAKYFVNTGSVGQPRDGDWRASYAIYNDANREVSVRRVEYDVEEAQRKILDAGLPELLAHRLALGK